MILQRKKGVRYGFIALPVLALTGIPPSLPLLHGGQVQTLPVAPPGIPEAMASLQRGDSAGAVKTMEAVTARDPKNARAWRVLGFVSLKAKEYDRALTAYNKALEIEPGLPAALYNIGVAYALKQDKEQAFRWLDKARTTHKLDMTAIQVDPDLVSLRGDPRFEALLPKPEEFANPFVEPVKIIREWDGEAMNDQFGWIARNMGDVNHDRHADLIVGAWQYAGAAVSGGRATLYSGKDGSLLKTYTCRIPGETFGFDAVGIGDVDGDGIIDLLITSAWSGIHGYHSGRMFILSSGIPAKKR